MSNMLILIVRYKDHINNYCIEFHIALYCVVMYRLATFTLLKVGRKTRPTRASAVIRILSEPNS